MHNYLPFLIFLFFSCTSAQEDQVIPTNKTISPKTQSPISFVKDKADQDGVYYIALETSKSLFHEEIQVALQPILSNYHTVRDKLQILNIGVLSIDRPQPMIFLKYFRKLSEAKEALSKIRRIGLLEEFTIDSYIMSQENFRLVLGNRSGLTQYHEFMANQ